MKRASYRDAVDFIAFNDSSDDEDPESIAGYMTVVLVASIFGVESIRVARDVARLRKNHERELRRATKMLEER